MDTSKVCWRGDYGDVKPVSVLRRPGAVLDDEGKLRAGYYDTEVQAWGGILSAAEESVNDATRRQQKALGDYDQAKRALIERRLNYTKITEGYDAFRRANARSLSAAV